MGAAVVVESANNTTTTTTTFQIYANTTTTTTTTFQIYAKCDTFVCPTGYKWRNAYEVRDCFNTVCDFYDRDLCCRKTGWAWWAWFLLALGICYCLLAGCGPLCALPLLGGKKKKKKQSRNQSDSDS